MADESSLQRLFRVNRPAMPQRMVWLPDGAQLQGGRFEIVRQLGSGAVGVVYEALDRGTPIALKTLTHLSPEQVYRLKYEFRSLTSVMHPNVVVVYELFADQETLFFTMEVIRGIPLAQYWNQRVQLPGSEARAPCEADLLLLRDQLRQIVEGVCAIHDAGLLHRDLKPNNVMVEGGGRIVILDFGLVSDQLPGGLGQTVQHVIAGTPGFMAPEQAAGLPTTTASDWYAVGVMLYQMLTRELPHRGTAQEVLRAKQLTAAVPAGQRVSGVPEDLDALCTSLLQLRPEARPSTDEMRALARSFTAQPPAMPRPTFSVRTSSSFIGRRPALQRLKELFRISRQGRPVLALLRAASGMGKTELMRSFVDSLQHGDDCFVIRGCCYEREAVPYKAFDEAIDDLTRILLRLSDEQAAQLVPRQAHALTRLFPVLLRVEAFRRAVQGPVETGQGQLQYLGFGAMREMLCRIADRRPLVLAIDDLQWGDVDSLRLINEVLAPPDPPRMLLIGTCRIDDAHNPLLAELLGSAQLQIEQIELGALAAHETLELVRNALVGDDPEAADLAERIARESQGIPLYALELARAYSELREGREPASLQQLIQRRVERLPAAARTILELTALSGRPLSRDVLVHICGSESYLAAMLLLRAARLVQSAAGSEECIEPYHDQVRQAVLAGLTPTDCVHHHQQLAAALEVSVSAEPEWLARHLCASGQRDKAHHYAVAAARQAIQVLAFNRAAELFALALELRDTAQDELELHRERAAALAGAGRGAEAAEAYLVAAQRASPAQALALEGLAAAQWLRVGHIDGACVLLRRVLARNGLRWPDSVPEAVARFLLNRARIRLLGLRFTIRPESEVPRDLLDKLDALYPAQTVLGTFDYVRGACFASSALPLALRAGEPKRLVNALASEAIYTIMLDGLLGAQRAGEIRDSINRVSASLEDPYVLGVSRLTASLCAYWAGQWSLVREPATKAEELFSQRVPGGTWEAALARSVRHTVAIHGAGLPQLAASVPRALVDAEGRSDRYAQLDLMRSLIAVHLLQDEPAQALALLERIDVLLQRFPITSINHLIASANVATHLYMQRVDEAKRELAARWEQCRKVGLHHFPLLRLNQIGMKADCVRADRARPASPRSRELLELAKHAGREPVSWAKALARAIEGSAFGLAGDRARAFNALDHASELYMGADMPLDAACARYEQSEYAPQLSARDLRERALEYFAQQGIARPEHFAAIVHSLY